MPERWEEIADSIDRLVAGPTNDQAGVARSLGVSIASGTPAPVAAAILGDRLSAALMAPARRGARNVEALARIEEELGLAPAPIDLSTSAAIVSGWIEARYLEKTSRGLRDLRPAPGDIVQGADPIGQRVISSVGANGRVYLKGRPVQSAWPNYLREIARPGDADYATIAAAVDAQLRNGRIWFEGETSASHFRALDQYKVSSSGPPAEAVRELEDLLESPEEQERPFQQLVERYPSFLAPLVFGHHGAFVIPQQRLGAEHVTDFLVVGLNSHGPQWVAVELEAPRHALRNGDGSLTTPVRHAMQQIQDWREWLTTNVAYAQTQLHLHSITNRIPGLVVIGRDEPSVERRFAASQVAEQQGIQVHSWDWFLRQARQTFGQQRARIGDFPETNPSLTPRDRNQDWVLDDEEWTDIFD